MKDNLHRNLKRGYTLVEVMMVLSIISLLAGVGYLVATNVRENTASTKLARDVAVVNQALTVFKVSGGSMADLTEPQAILNRLKTRLVGDDAKAMAGLKDGLVDSRLAVQIQTAAQAGTNEERAYWSATSGSFYIAKNGAEGIREFYLDEALAAVDYGTATRRSSFDLAKQKQWVWDYSNNTAGSKAGPSGVPLGNPGTTPGNPGTPPGALKLNPPVFSIPTGNYALGTYPKSLTLTNPNPAGSSNILYSVNGTDWRNYSGALAVNPGDKVDAMIGALDPDKWIDSDKGTERYTTSPLAPVFDLTFDKTAYSYIDLGGALIPGSSPTTPSSKSGVLKLTNGDAIPSTYQSSTYFVAKWTMDGSSPLTSSTAVKGTDFTNGFAQQQIPLKLSDYGTNAEVTVKAASSSLQTSVLSDSSVVQKKLGIQELSLRAPIVTVKDRDVTMALDTQYGDLPVGSRIYYTTDGTDPGDASGKPARGTLYTGPFTMSGTTGTTLKVIARVYAPDTYAQWFDPSTSVSQDVKIPAAIDFFVGGNFYFNKGSGTVMRNIAKLKGGGTVDSSFDVGQGTSENSLVGVIRQEPAGKVMAGGDFESVNNVARPAVVRLNPNGSVDTGFNAGLAGGK
jgi:prepilin-type N-terminal cleavage/methylation domain-containing protein